MSESLDVQAGKELAGRHRELYATKMNNTIVMDDGTNEAKIPGFPYIFKAQGDKILVSVDIFKSGYECKDCMGTGEIHSKCNCEVYGNPGKKYALDTEGLTPAQALMKCPLCEGNWEEKHKDIQCTLCKGTGATLFIPDDSKTQPTTGVVVSVGNKVSNTELVCGTRVLFGCYTGVMIPTKVPGIVFKVLRDIEVLCTIRGGEDLAAFDFLEVEKEL